MFRLIDHAFLWLIILSLLFIVFTAVTGESLLFSGLLAAGSCLLLRPIILKVQSYVKSHSCRSRQLFIRQLLEQWARLPEKEAAEKIHSLLVQQFNANADEALIILPFAKDSAAFTTDVVLSCWRQNIGRNHITLAAYCPADSAAQRLCEELSRPSVEIADSAVLEKLLMSVYPVVPEMPEVKKRGLRSFAEACQALLSRVSLKKSVLYTVLMLALFFMNGSLIFLAGFGLFLALSAMATRRRLADQSASRSIFESLRALR